MDDRRLRRKQPVSYEISSDSDSAEAPSSGDSVFGTPQKLQRSQTSRVIDLEEESVQETDSPATTPPPRYSAAGHSLRQHKDLNMSLKASENADRPRRKKRHVIKRQPKRLNPKTDVQEPVLPTERNQIRHTIATGTTTRRSNFFVAHKDLFLPLLPKTNHIERLVSQRSNDDIDILAVSDSIADLESQDLTSRDLSVPYEALEKQPNGVKAVMKPYQLSGLSFLVYLHRNGLSGILGDEMGLGKTLQTLSLIQYLKENMTGRENRPSLVVCPLSVLSSWMAEARRWTPDLKVLRFHGPALERNRLKRVATGEEDIYGNETKRHRNKRRDRMTKKGKPIIDLDSEPETDNEAGVDLVVTTYEGFKSEEGWLKKAFVWNYVILDEGHRIKNDESQVSKSLQSLSAEFRLILTGTPLQNNMLELWALLHWLYPEVFTVSTSDAFKASFDLTRGTVNTDFMDNARKLLERIMLRRMKNSEGVNLNLPPKKEVLLYMPLTPMQRFWYTRLLTRADQGLLEELFQNAQQKEVTSLGSERKQNWEDKNVEELEALDKTSGDASWEESKEILKKALEQEQQDEKKKSAWRKLMNLLIQLRKCCNSAYLLPHAEPNPYYIGEHIIHASAKLIVLDKIVNELVIKQKKKILIFSGFTRMLDCVEDFLSLRGGTREEFKYTRLDGSTARARRNLGIRLFNKQQSEHRVMLISTRAGGLGINLASASDVILLDQDWNPQITLQAEARAHRIGQTNPVTVYKLCTQGTVEEQMMGRIQKKLYLSAKVTESMRNVHSPASNSRNGPGGRIGAKADDDMPQLDTSQLMSLVRRGAQALTHPELDINEMLGWDWSTMLERCKDNPSNPTVAEDTGVTVNSEDEKKWLSQMEHVESRVFQGKKYAKQKDNSFNNISEDWSREQRRIGKETTVMVGSYAISKESMSCADWEAVPTMAGKNPNLAEPKREKKPQVNNQDVGDFCS